MEEKAVIEKISKVLGMLGGAVALFYLIGYVIVQSYVAANGLEGVLLPSPEFYRDAGAKFLLDLVRAPLTTGYFFFPYLYMLWWVLAPKADNIGTRDHEKLALTRRDYVQLVALVVWVILTYVLAVMYDFFAGQAWYVDFMRVFVGTAKTGETLSRAAVGFFNLVTPAVLVLGYVVYHVYQWVQKELLPRRVFPWFLTFYIIYVAVLPISYGMSIYDLRVIPVVSAADGDNKALWESTSAHEPWLLGEFGGKVYFLRKHGDFPPLSIQAIDAGKIKFLDVDYARASSLKYQVYEGAAYQQALRDEAYQVLRKGLEVK
ncbi:MAG: hypothetical protein OEW08_13485 [Gammaproteobacteria bacterium]|nr:hypothetical protein [Gammaproteobacteria bacterium]